VILEELSETRREAVEGVPLGEARRVLRRRAEDMEIRHWNEILRVLVELEELERLRDQRWLLEEDVLQLVEPDQRNPTAEHVVNPRTAQGAPATLCGYRADDWLQGDTVPWSAAEALLKRPRLCDRCRRSLQTRIGGS
jgi:hypothetical protein